MSNELEKNIETETKDNPAVKTAEELEARIKQLEAENGKLRQANTNASADASKWKKQYQEADEKYKSTLSEEEQKKIKHDEEIATLRNERDQLLTERNVASHKAQLLSIGFEDSLAQSVAEALNAGETAKIFDGLRKFITAHDKALKENAFRNNPTLPGGGAETKAISKEQFDKMGYTERVEVFEKYPDLYQEYTK